MKVFISIIYIILFIISEFRLKNVKFLISIPYAVALMICLCSVLFVDSFVYEFSSLAYFVISLILTVQVYSFICRIYLWNGDNNPWGQVLHHNAHQGEFYNPRTMSFYDCVIMMLLCLYIYISVDDFRRLKLRFDI